MKRSDPFCRKPKRAPVLIGNPRNRLTDLFALDFQSCRAEVHPVKPSRVVYKRAIPVPPDSRNNGRNALFDTPRKAGAPPENFCHQRLKAGIGRLDQADVHSGYETRLFFL
jgi:hypothetical protein